MSLTYVFTESNVKKVSAWGLCFLILTFSRPFGVDSYAWCMGNSVCVTVQAISL